ncbi:hypothetical protein LCGC14_1743850, partial [marine sediment metagenome]
VRNAVASLVNHWHDTLTAGQRTDWETYAANTAFVNRLGDPTFLSGINQYVRSNVPRIQALLARVDDAPATFNTGEFTAISIVFSEALGQLVFSFQATDAWNNEDGSALIAWSARPQNDTINFFKGPYRKAGVILGSLALPLASPQNMVPPFLAVEDQKLFGTVRISRADGRLSVKQDFGIIALA